jgi:FtsZ-binding cell division protein ZapB
MITLEQVRLLETKITRAVDYVKKITGENSHLKEKLDSCQKRVDEMEALVQSFKDDQNRLEDGILAALDRLNQFEDAIGSVLSPESSAEAAPLPPSPQKKAEPVKPAFSPEEKKEEAGDSGQDNGELDIF